MATLIVVYLGMTLAYHYVLPMTEVISADTTEAGSQKAVAAVYCRALAGWLRRDRDLDSCHVLNLYLDQRQCTDRPARLFRHGARRPAAARPGPCAPAVRDARERRAGAGAVGDLAHDRRHRAHPRAPSRAYRDWFELLPERLARRSTRRRSTTCSIPTSSSAPTSSTCWPSPACSCCDPSCPTCRAPIAPGAIPSPPCSTWSAPSCCWATCC